MHIRPKIYYYISIIGILALIPILILGFILARDFLNKGKDLKSEHIMLVHQISSDLQLYLGKQLLIIETLARQTQVLSSDALTEVIDKVEKYHPEFSEIYIDNSKYQISSKFAFIDTDYKQAKEQILYSNIDKSSFLSLTKPFLSPLTTGPDGRETIFIAIPLRLQGVSTNGFIMGVLDLSNLDDIMEKYKINTSGYSVLVDNTGRLIYYPGQKPADPSVLPVLKEIKKNNNGSLEYFSPILKRWEIADYLIIPDYGWGLWVAAPQYEIMLDLYGTARLSLVLVVLSFSMIIFIRYLLVSNIYKPLTELDRACQEYSSGNLSYRTQMNNSMLPVEIKTLGEKLNYMAAKLQQKNYLLKTHSDNLEKRINERTNELVIKNREINEKHNTLLAVMDSMSDGLVLFDARAKIVYANPIFLRIFNMEKYNWHGWTYRRLKSFLNQHGYKLPYKDLRENFIHKSIFQYKEIIILKNDKKNYYLIQGYPVLSNDSFIGYGCILRNVTREKEIDSLKNSILSTVSHELRTPLTIIRGNAESLLRKDVEWGSDEAEIFLKAIVDESKRLRELVDNIMDMSKIEAGALNLQLHSTDIRKVIEHVVNRFKQRFPDYRFIVEHQADLPFVRIDEKRIDQVLSNLIENGKKYSSDDYIKIETAYLASEKKVKVSVIDHGIGIEAELYQAIFERFFRINDPMTKKISGSGVGLSISKGIIEAHGGTIWVNSIINNGSKFEFTLPCAEHILDGED